MSGCALPINDVYGDESCQNVEPDCVMTKSELKGQGYAVTSAAKDKDIATLLTFIDYLYSDEGAVLATFGLSPEQMEEIGTSFYEDNGIPNGTYEVNEEGKNEMVETIRQDSGGLKNAAVLSRFPCLKKVSILDEGYADSYQHSLDLWIQYKGGADVWATPAVSNLPEKDSKVVDDVMTKCQDYVTINAVTFIKGEKDIDSDEDWGTWCKMLEKYNYKKALDVLQPYVDKYGLHANEK